MTTMTVAAALAGCSRAPSLPQVAEKALPAAAPVEPAQQPTDTSWPPPTVAKIELPAGPFDDAALAELPAPQAESSLDLSRMQITDAGLAARKEWGAVVDLNLSGTQVTDAGVAHLAAATRLRRLNLSHTQITEAALATIKQFPALIEVKLHGTSIPREAQLEMIQFFGPRYQQSTEQESRRHVPADFSHPPFMPPAK